MSIKLTFLTTIKGKGKSKVCTRIGHEGPHVEYRYSSTLSLISALDGGGCLTPRPGRITTGKGTRYPLCRRLNGPQGRSGRARKTSFLPGFDPRTIQPVLSGYTDCSIPNAHNIFTYICWNTNLSAKYLTVSYVLDFRVRSLLF